ncbi:MAG: hypothetical protein PHW04_06515 [Candidatus Wallbacteria bacterium]|nr:hypothetical protein [Candidatus Wallbacteria bacterium]
MLRCAQPQISEVLQPALDAGRNDRSRSLSVGTAKYRLIFM